MFTPLLAGWSIWIGIDISTRASEIRVAQQLGLLANLPSVAVTTLIAVGVIHASRAIAIGGVVLLLVSTGSAGGSRRRCSTGNGSSPAPEPREAGHQGYRRAAAEAGAMSAAFAIANMTAVTMRRRRVPDGLLGRVTSRHGVAPPA